MSVTIDSVATLTTKCGSNQCKPGYAQNTADARLQCVGEILVVCMLYKYKSRRKYYDDDACSFLLQSVPHSAHNARMTQQRASRKPCVTATSAIRATPRMT